MEDYNKNEDGDRPVSNRMRERIKQFMEDANKKLMEDPNKKGWRWAERLDGDGQSTSAAGSDQPS
jgi:hypothetical protein